MQESSEVDPDSLVMGAAAFKVIQTNGIVASWASARLNDNPQEVQAIYNARNQFTQNAYQLLDAGAYDSLSTLMQRMLVRQARLGIDRVQTQQFFIKYDEVTESENTYTNWFNLFYCLGSLLLGVGFVRSEVIER
jgi:hypothetical protein